jgi:hypothetical protein
MAVETIREFVGSLGYKIDESASGSSPARSKPRCALTCRGRPLSIQFPSGAAFIPGRDCRGPHITAAGDCECRLK